MGFAELYAVADDHRHTAPYAPPGSLVCSGDGGEDVVGDEVAEIVQLMAACKAVRSVLMAAFKQFYSALVRYRRY